METLTSFVYPVRTQESSIASDGKVSSAVSGCVLKE